MAVTVVLASRQDPDTTLRQSIVAAVAADSIETTDSLVAHPTVLGVIPADLDGDGHPEAVVWVAPAFRQTPTILLYHQELDRTWHRLTEGLVAGRLQAPDDRQVDLHTKRVAVDFDVEKSTKPLDVDDFLSHGVETGMSFVAYRSFFHGDARSGAPFMVNLTSWATLPKDAGTCEFLAFAEVSEVVFGRLQGTGAQDYLVALTSQDVTIYRIQGIRWNGFLNKQVWLVARAPGPAHLTRSPDGTLALEEQGRLTPIRVP
jgi:hypothetical protein